MPLQLSMTCGPYDRCKALIDGSVRPEGIELNITVNSDDNGRQAEAIQGKFDVVEFYTGRYIADLPFRSLGFTAIPVFVKRMFRHSYIYVNKRSNISSPADLNGKRIGLQTWFTSASIWVRGILADEYGVDLHSIGWIAEKPDSIQNWQPPEWLKFEFAPADRRKVFDLLVAGDIDAAITTEALAPNRHPDVDFLFPNYPQVEREYYRKTGIFPINHTLLVRNSILQKEPHVAMSLFNAWEESKQRCYKWLEWQRIHQTSMWYRALWEEERAAGGPDFYKWGFRKTRREVDKMLEYSHQLGITPRKFEPEEMFWQTTLDT
jgi:4,5-dihydroxyphthalate decarboxylase